MNQADDHHPDRLDFHERALKTKSAGLTGNLTGVELTNDGPGKSSVVIYLPDNGRSAPLDDDLRPEDLLQDCEPAHILRQSQRPEAPPQDRAKQPPQAAFLFVSLFGGEYWRKICAYPFAESRGV